MPISRRRVTIIPWRSSRAAVAHRNLLAAPARRLASVWGVAEDAEKAALFVTERAASEISASMLLADLRHLDKEVRAGFVRSPDCGVLIAVHAARRPIIHGHTATIYLGLQVRLFVPNELNALEALKNADAMRIMAPRPMICTFDDPMGGTVTMYAAPEGRDFAYAGTVARRITEVLEKNPANNPLLVPNVETSYLFYTQAGWARREAEFYATLL